jgi:hypothetical protein
MLGSDCLCILRLSVMHAAVNSVLSGRLKYDVTVTMPAHGSKLRQTPMPNTQIPSTHAPTRGNYGASETLSI